MACKYPDRWLDYTKIGAQVEGTQFIALKVPLGKKYFIKREHESFTPSDVIQQIPNLGLVVDLTFTSKYYNPSEFQQHNVQHMKILTKGHEIPNRSLVDRFIRTVNDFLAKDENKDKLIGVHCTHGLNRTGYFVCAYMILAQGQEPKSAISAFNAARAHTMERANYLNHLRSLTSGSNNAELNNATHNNGQEVIHDANHARDRHRRGARHFDRHHSDRHAENWRDRPQDNWRDRPRENRNGFLLDGGVGGDWGNRHSYEDRRNGWERNRSYNYRNYGRYGDNHRDATRSNGDEACSSGYAPRNGEPHHNRFNRNRKTNSEADNYEK